MTPSNRHRDRVRSKFIAETEAETAIAGKSAVSLSTVPRSSDPAFSRLAALWGVLAIEISILVSIWLIASPELIA